DMGAPFCCGNQAAWGDSSASVAHATSHELEDAGEDPQALLRHVEHAGLTVTFRDEADRRTDGGYGVGHGDLDVGTEKAAAQEDDSEQPKPHASASQPASSRSIRFQSSGP